VSKKYIETSFGMNLPRKLMVGAVPYLVEDAKLEADFGDCDTDKKLIRIDLRRHLTVQQLLVTWHHETGHAIACEYGVKLAERDTDRMAQGRTQVLTDWMEAQ